MSTIPLSPADFQLLCNVIASVARTSGLPAQDAEDFAQHVHLHLMERRYAALTAFGGRSSLRTYLTVVVRRILLDWRNHRFGKWRPSRQAKRLGPVAVLLDRLMSRDGHRSEEAVAMLKGRPSCTQSQPLRDLASRLPRRRRVQTVVPETFEGLAAAFEDPVEAAQATEARRLAMRRLRRACRQLSEDDRRLLALRYHRGLSIRDIAGGLGLPDKPLYRRMERIVASLRRAMAAVDGLPADVEPAADRSSGIWLTH